MTEKDVCDAVAEGFDNIETLKRYSTVSMGPCQGKMCQMAAIAICAQQTSRTIEETGTTTARPPYNPITLGVLAGRNHHYVQGHSDPFAHGTCARLSEDQYYAERVTRRISL